ncbi:efflux RND transporter permease subunit [Tundrisphaera lichenicola]|uniref:efflux RND transporter permease subunit n=1 Tax=Tundrisphaera lichenicola TaxID=2029860 RepID=UPI003EC01536
MIARLIAFSINHRVAVIISGILLAIWGAIAAYHTPVDAIPDLSENQVIVFTEWIGHSPREIEDQVSFPLSSELQGIRGVRVVRSSSDFNFSMIHVIFDDSIDFATARKRVIERLPRAREFLPEGVSPLPPPDSAATGQIYWYSVEGGGLDLGALRSIQDGFVRPQLSSVPGVAEVASVGGYPVEFQVNVDPNRLQSHRVTLASVAEAVARSNGSLGGPLIQKANAEYIVRSVGRLGADPKSIVDSFTPDQALRDLENAVLAVHGPRVIRIADVAKVAIGPGPRRGVLEKDGNEVSGGVVLMAYGENPLEVTRRIKQKIRDIKPGLPEGVRIIPFYDRTPLIRGALRTVVGTIIEAVITSTVCVLLILLHARASFVIALTVPLAALASFAMMGVLRSLGIIDVQTNVMSLAGIAISVGVLVDSSIVMVENAIHALRDHFGDEPAKGDIRAIVLPACQTVGRPIFFSVLIMLISFLPVFALGGMEGKMFRPLAFTKSLALMAVMILSVTLVPALCTVLLKGRIRGERESWLVRSVIDVYRPVLASLLDRPAPLVWVLGVTFVVGFAPLGSETLFRCTLLIALIAIGWSARSIAGRAFGLTSLTIIALVADFTMPPLGREFITPLDEGMIMDMPITVPRASVTESADDLKARDMVLCHFPEVEMVVGKAGRAESPSDPAPMDMIESMVSFRSREYWPRRKMARSDAELQVRAVFDALEDRRWIVPPPSSADLEVTLAATVDAVMPPLDVLIREYAYQRNKELERDFDAPTTDPEDPDFSRQQSLWYKHINDLNEELVPRAAETLTRLALEELLSRCEPSDPNLAALVSEIRGLRMQSPSLVHGTGSHHHHGAAVPEISADPAPELEALQSELSDAFASRLSLWRKDRDELVGFGADLDQAVQMPGWTNVWTTPIQNRVDMLATGVNTDIGVRVLGPRLDEVVAVSGAVAAVLKKLPNAVDVVADPVRGKGYINVRPDRFRAEREGVTIGAINDAVEGAIGGLIASTIHQGRERRPVRVRYGRDWRGDEEAIRAVLVPSLRNGPDGKPRLVRLADVADVSASEGPATIKGENSLLRNYVRLNVRGMSSSTFVESARPIVAREVKLPEGVVLEWAGQFEHERRARNTLLVIVPLVVLLIFAILYWTYHDLADSLLMLLAVPGAVAGGIFFQWLLGFKFSVTVWVGYIACFGMATSTGIIMLVYLREALSQAGGLEGMSESRLRHAVLEGAVHRLRPKLLTEGTVLLGLAPMLWASGIGSEVIRPMVAPVLGGVLIADEVIDLLLPVLFYQVRLRRLRGIRPSLSSDRAGTMPG